MGLTFFFPGILLFSYVLFRVFIVSSPSRPSSFVSIRHFSSFLLSACFFFFYASCLLFLLLCFLPAFSSLLFSPHYSGKGLTTKIFIML